MDLEVGSGAWEWLCPRCGLRYEPCWRELNWPHTFYGASDCEPSCGAALVKVARGTLRRVVT